MEHNDHDLLIRLNEKLDNLIGRFVSHDALEVKERGLMESRLTELERWKYRWVGGIGVAVLLISFITNVMVRILIR